MKAKAIAESFISKFYGSYVLRFALCLLLSWFYAVCSQIIIPLPFNFVPISLQPAPLYLLSLTLGWPAVYAFLLTIFQAALGAPFFSGFEGGIVKLLGPTGGYILGWALSAVFLVLVKDYKKNYFVVTFFKLCIASFIMYACGLFQLSLYIPVGKLFLVGLCPFIFGCLLKMILVTIFFTRLKKH